MRRRHALRLTLLLPLSLSLVVCAGGQLPEVRDVRDVSAAHGAPTVERITDLGAVRLPRQGRLTAEHRDGSAVIGELLLVEGSRFGKQPTVTIGGRPAAVLAHVAGGGVVVRVPWGIDAGSVEVEVANAAGRHSLAFPVRRVGLIVDGRSLQGLEVKPDGSVSLGSATPLAGARLLAISPEGAAAYVAGESPRPRLWVVDLAGPAPTVVHEHELPGTKVLDLATADQASLGAVVTDTHVVTFETSDPLSPALYAPVAIPPSLARKNILAAALGGQGRSLALLLADLNQVATFGLADPGRPAAPEIGDVLPEVPLQVAHGVRFSTDEGSLWVVSGDTPRSIAAGLQPLRVTLLQPRGREVAVHRTWELGDKEAPLALALARGEPIPPGTSIRAEPSTSSVYVAVMPSARLQSAGDPAGAVLRASLGKSTERLLAGPRTLTSIDVVGRKQVLLALGFEREGGGLRRVLLSQRAWEKEAPRVLPLSPLATAPAPGVPEIGVLRAQP